jgi:tRNA A37 threonylcarbamoyladenosine biosynthesis protein TsaE
LSMRTNHQVQVLTHLKTGKTLSQAEAIHHFDCYRLEDIAQHLGMSFEEAEQYLLRMMDNRQKVGLSNDGVLIDSNININLVQ